MIVFVAGVLACSVCAWAGWHCGRQMAKAPAPVGPGFVVEVYDHLGLRLWQRFSTVTARDAAVRAWSDPEFGVLVYDPGERHKRVVHGADRFEEWESVWAVDA